MIRHACLLLQCIVCFWICFFVVYGLTTEQVGVNYKKIVAHKWSTSTGFPLLCGPPPGAGPPNPSSQEVVV